MALPGKPYATLTRSHTSARKDRRNGYMAAKLTEQNTTQIGLKINMEKTKMLSIDVSRHTSDINSNVNINGCHIEGGNELHTMLGSGNIQHLKHTTVLSGEQILLQAVDNQKFKRSWNE